MTTEYYTFVDFSTVLGILRWIAAAFLVLLVIFFLIRQAKLKKSAPFIISFIIAIILIPLLILTPVKKTVDPGNTDPDTPVNPIPNVDPTPEPQPTPEPEDDVKPDTPVTPTPGKKPKEAPSTPDTPDQPDSPDEPDDPTTTPHKLTLDNAEIISDDKSGEYPVGTEIQIKANEKLGYHFARWSSNDSATDGNTNDPLTFNMPDTDLQISPVYEPNTNTPYKVIHRQQNFDDDEYSVIETETLTGTTDATVTPDTKAYTGFDAPEKQSIKIEADGSSELTYDYNRKIIAYSVEDAENVISSLPAGNYKYGTIVTLEAKERTGYSFSHWNDPSASTDNPATISLTDDIAVKPVYTANQYRILFDGNENTGGSMSPQTMTYDVAANLAANAFVNAGYTFVHWNTAKDDSGTSYDDGQSVINLATEGDYQLYAIWQAGTDTPYTVNHYKMNLTGDGYESPISETLYGETATQVTPAVKSYTGFTSPSTQTVTINGDGSTTVNYYYARNKYTITFGDPTHTTSRFVSGEQYYYGTTEMIHAVAWAGHTFDDWNDGTTNPNYQYTITDQNVTLTPNYHANPYTVTFHSNIPNTADQTSTQDFVYDDPEKPLDTNSFTRTGYHFDKWTTNSDGTGDEYADQQSVKNLVESGNLDLYAKWAPNTNTAYKVIHQTRNLNDSDYTNREVESLYGTSDAEITPTVNTYTGFDSPSPQTTTIAPDGSTKVTYKYERQTRHLEIQDSEFVDTDTTTDDYPYETQITLTAKEREGYTFVKWSDDSTNQTISFILTTDVTIKPIYEAKTYKIVYHKNTGDSTPDEEQTRTYDELPFNLAANTFDYPGYYFRGWATSASATVKEYSDQEEITDNLSTGSNFNLYAVWEEMFPVVFNVAGNCTFNGANGVITTPNTCEDSISGTDFAGDKYIDSGIKLYDDDNFDKDYEVTFDIVSYDYSQQDEPQATFFSTKAPSDYVGANNNPGMVIRQSSDKIDYNNNRGNGESAASWVVMQPIEKVHIVRRNGVIYIGFNDPNLLYELQDLETTHGTFDLSAWFGAYPQYNASTQEISSKRVLNGTLANMQIRLGEIPAWNKYTITFDLNGGHFQADTTGNRTALIDQGASIEVFPYVYRDNYLFDYWYDVATDQRVDDGVTPTGDTTYKVHWTKKVTQANVTTGMELLLRDTGTINVANRAELEPFTFVSNNTSIITVDPDTGEYTAIAEGTTTIDLIGTRSGEKKTINVSVAVPVYTVEFFGCGGSVIGQNVYEVREGDTIPVLPTAERENHAFYHWEDTIGEGGNIFTPETVITADKEVYAHWKQNVEYADVTLSASSITRGQTGTITVTKNPGSSETLEDFTLTSSDESILTVDQSGNITTLSADTAKIRITGSLSHLVREVTVTVTLPKYLVHFNAGDGTTVNDIEVEEGGHIDPIPSSTLANYVLEGWYNGSDKLTTATAIMGEVTYTANWLKDVSQAAFNQNSFTIVEGETDALIVTNANELEGYTLSTLDTTIAEIDANGVITAHAAGDTKVVLTGTLSGLPNQIVEVHIVLPTYTVTFDANGGEAVESEQVQKGGTISVPTTTYNHHVLDGWFNGANQLQSDTPIMGDITYTARWTQSVYYADVTPSSFNLTKYDEATLTINNPDEFESFSLSSQDTSVATINGTIITAVSAGTTNIVIAGDRSGEEKLIPVVVSPLYYAVTFNYNDGVTPTETINVEENHKVESIPSATREHYVFYGWWNGNIELDEDYVVTAPITFTASWKGDVEQAVFNHDSFTLTEGETAEFYVENAGDIEEFNVTIADDDVVIYNGPTITAKYKGTTVLTVTGNKSLKTKTVTITVNPIMRTVSFNAHGGSTPASIEVENGTLVPTAQIPTSTRQGYTLDGWWTEEQGGTSITEKIIDTVITFHAHWTPNTDTTYTVYHAQQNLLDDDYTIVTADTDHLTGTTDSTVTPARKSYTGFVTPAAEQLTILPDGSAELTYYYDREQIAFTINNASYVTSTHASGTYKYGTEVTLSANNRTGYNFVNWTYNTTALADNPVAITLTTTPTTIGPNYEEKTYTVIFHSHTGGTDETVTQNFTYFETKTLTANSFTYVYHTFNKWTTSADGTGDEYDDKESVQSLTENSEFHLYAQWTEDSDVIVCREATVLETEQCESSGSCSSAPASSFSGGTIVDGTITYGALPHKVQHQAGDAFDCDVTGQGDYKRFYYLSDDGTNAKLVYHSNYNRTTTPPGDDRIASVHYDSALELLPTAAEWTNPLFVPYAQDELTRFLTKNDVITVCGNQPDSSNHIDVKSCIYLLQDTAFRKASNTTTGPRSGIWLYHENNEYYRIQAHSLYAEPKESSDSSENSARPVIQVPLANIEPAKPATRYQITFESNGGTPIDPIEAIEDTPLASLPTPQKELHDFGGWFLDDETFENEVKAGDIITEDVLLYAKWTEANVVAKVENDPTNYQSLQDAVSNVPTTGVKTKVTLYKNVQEKITILNSQNIELDLQNNTLTCVTGSKNANAIQNSGTLEITRGNFTCASSGDGNATIKNNSNGTMIISGGTFESTASNVIANHGSMTISGGNIRTSNAQGAVNNESTGTLLITGGQISANGTGNGGRQALYNNGGTTTIDGDAVLTSATDKRATAHNRSSGTLNIISGSITSNAAYAVYNENGTLNIGVKNGRVNTTSPLISGKTYGVVANTSNKYNFYDGTLRGETYSIGKTTGSGNTPTITTDSAEPPVAINDIEDNADYLKGTDENYQTLTLALPTVGYRIHFEPHGGSTPSPSYIDVTPGDRIGNNFPTTTRASYIFLGWYDAPDNGNLVDENTIPTGDAIYYAYWQHDDTIVEFNVQSEAVQNYFANIDSWMNDTQNNFLLSMKGNFDNHQCKIASEKDIASTTIFSQDYRYAESGTVYCDRPVAYDTNVSNIKVYLSDNNRTKGAEATYLTTTDGKITNMIPNTVYRWESISDPTVYGFVKATGTENRIISLATARNVRDMGGLTGTYGTIKYGRLLRGEALGTGDVAALTKLGITMEYDLRGEVKSPNMGSSDPDKYKTLYTVHYNIDPADSTINTYNQNHHPSESKTNYEITRDRLISLMQDIIAGKNIYYHCSHGSDRTGTIAYLVEGLLGIDFETRKRDYELTAFSGRADRTRYYTQKNTDTYPSREYDGYKKFVYMTSPSGLNLQTPDDIEAWFKANLTDPADIQAADDLIENFRAAMIEGYGQ